MHNKEGGGGEAAPVTWLSLPNKPQLLILALCRLSEPLSNTCLLPYLYYLIRSLQTTPNVSSASISRQAGLLVSLFALAQFATSVPWAWVANHWGRKPSIVIGLCLAIISNIGFGFSTTVPAVMFWRILAGVGNGNIGVMRTMTAEVVVEKKYQSRAFLLLPLVFNSGVVIGLAVGGFLADPIVNLPWLFGPHGLLNWTHDADGVEWMRDYPFSLPTLFNAGALLCSLMLAVCGLKETAPGRQDQNDRDPGLVVGRACKRIFLSTFLKDRYDSYVAISPEDEEDLIDSNTPRAPLVQHFSAPSRPITSRSSITSRAIWTREVTFTIISFAVLPLHNSAFMQLFPVFLSTPPSETSQHPTSPIIFTGGLGLSSPTIGLFLSSFGIFGILLQLLIYPSLQAWLGTLGSYRVALSIFPIAYVLAPYLSMIPDADWFVQYAGIAFILFIQVTARTFGIPSSVILLTNSSPSPLALAAVHGVGNMFSSLCRAVGPALGGLIFGWSLERGAVGIVWWAYLTFFSLAGLAWSWTMTEGEHPAARAAKEVQEQAYIELAMKGEDNESNDSRSVTVVDDGEQDDGYAKSIEHRGHGDHRLSWKDN